MKNRATKNFLDLMQTGGQSFLDYYRSVPVFKNDTTNYNLREYFNRNPVGAREFANNPEGHAPDSFKLPNHPTFSDESIYFNQQNKDKAGHWQENKDNWMYIPYNPKVKDTIIEKKQNGGISMTGYKSTSKDKNRDYNIIPGNNLTMVGVPHPVMAYPSIGQPKLMYPEVDSYVFPGATSVKEIPIKQVGGWLDTYQQGGSAPFITSDKTLYDKRKQAYDDSLHLYNITAPDVKVFNNPDNSFGDFSDYMKNKYGINKNKSNLLHTVTNDTYKEDPAYNRLSEYNGLDGVNMHRDERKWMAGLQTGIVKYFDAPKQQVLFDSPIVQQLPIKKSLSKSKPISRIDPRGLQQLQGQPQQMVPLQLPVDQSDYVWHSPEQQNGIYTPPGFYPPYKSNLDPTQDTKFQEGGLTSQKGWLENIISKVPGYTPPRQLKPWEYRRGDEIHTDVNALPTTDRYAPDVKWQQDWINQRNKQYNDLAQNQVNTYAKEHPILNFFGGNDNPQELVKTQKANTINNLKTLKFSDEDKIDPKSYVDAAMGEYSPSKHRIVFAGSSDDNTKAHEIGHGTHLASWEPSQTYINQVTSQDPRFKTYKNSEGNTSYYKSPEEIYSHIWGLRREWGLKPTDVVTPEVIQKNKKGLNIFGTDDNDEIFKYLNEDSIIKLMNGLVSNNEFPSTNPISQYGGQQPQQEPDPMAWLSDGEQPASLPHQRQRAFHGRTQSKINKSLYQPHPAINRFKTGGWLDTINY